MKKEKVLKKLRQLGDQGIQAWVKTLPDDEIIETMEILNDFAKATPIYKTSSEFRRQIAEAENSLNVFKEKVLQEKVQNLLQEIEMDSKFKALEENYNQLRSVLISEIEKNPDKADELQRIAIGLIEIEKQYNNYDTKKWEPFFNLINKPPL